MKKTIISIALLMLTLASTANAFSLDKKGQDTVLLEGVYQVIHAADWYTTVKGIHDGYTEVNPLIGARPTDMKMHGYFLASAVLHAVVIYVAPEEYREFLQKGSIGLKWALVDHNNEVDANPRKGWYAEVSWNY